MGHREQEWPAGESEPPASSHAVATQKTTIRISTLTKPPVLHHYTVLQ